MKEISIAIFSLFIIIAIFGFNFYMLRLSKKDNIIMRNDSIIVQKLDTVIYRLEKVDTIQN